MGITVPQIFVIIGILAITALCFIFGGKKIDNAPKKDISDIFADIEGK